jgi:hypothetical protein
VKITWQIRCHHAEQILVYWSSTGWTEYIVRALLYESEYEARLALQSVPIPRGAGTPGGSQGPVTPYVFRVVPQEMQPHGGIGSNFHR